MKSNLKLFYLLLGCTPANRHTEQHDVFFCIGESLSLIKEDIAAFWHDGGKIHIDCWREVASVDGYEVSICDRDDAEEKSENLFFINLGGYLPDSFEEHHYKLLTVTKDMAGAVSKAKQTKFYIDYNTDDKKGVSHVDNKYGVDVDEIFNVEDILPQHQKEKFAIQLTKKENLTEDQLHIGYLKWSNI
ncbi:MAG: hypothetical protein BGN92_05680 [Sphingobacteriales bacterium 41-5]|nr:MAG: hypothetical protein BGN92_05680 [Sphingobacteriales bacterium 41-5]